MTRPINSAGIALIKAFEGLRTAPYQDSGGVWSIGYGHTKNVKKDSPDISEVQAEAFLLEDVAQAGELVTKFIHTSLTDNQYSALVSLVYNVGATPLVHTLGSKLNASDVAGAAEEFLRWHYADGKVSDGLARRRVAERELFLSAT